MKVKWMFPLGHSRAAYTFSYLAERLGLAAPQTADVREFRDNDLVIAWGGYAELDKLPANANIVSIFNSQKLDNLEQAESHASTLILDTQRIPVLSAKARPSQKNWQKASGLQMYRHRQNNWYFIPFDIVLNIFYHLSRFEERGRHFSDEQVTDHQSSILWHNGRLLNPVVDELLQVLRKALDDCAANAGLPLVTVWPWPGGENYAAALTHDVDLTRGLSYAEHGKQLGKNLLTRLAGNFEKAEKKAIEIRDKSHRLWTFTDLQALYHKHNISATFFFIAKTLEGLHVRYYTGSDRFRRLFTQLKVNGHEIGLHPSLKAFDNPESYTLQRNRLNTHATTTINGMRQHYLRCRFPRLWKLAELAGMSYDSSLGYNFAAGFRAGTVFPFKPYDSVENTPRALIEFPLMFFENSLNDEDPEKQLTTILENVKKHNGLLTALLHPSSYSDEKWQRIWQNLAKQLANDNAWRVALETLERWISNRASIVVNSKKEDDNTFLITIKKPAYIEKFALGLPAYKELKAVSKVKMDYPYPQRVVIRGKQKNIKLRLRK